VRIFGVPEALQRMAFSVFCVDAADVYLLGCPAWGPGAPTGFVLDSAGRIAATLHIGGQLLDALAAPAGCLWAASLEALAQGSSRLVLQGLSREDEVLERWPLPNWLPDQLGCLALVEGRLLLAGIASDGSTRIERLGARGPEPLPVASIGRPLAVGASPR